MNKAFIKAIKTMKNWQPAQIHGTHVKGETINGTPVRGRVTIGVAFEEEEGY